MSHSCGWRGCNATARVRLSIICGCRRVAGWWGLCDEIILMWLDGSVSVHPDQGCLLPADMRSWLPPGHLAWQVLGAVGELDMSGFTAAYRADGQGQAPYDPAMMLTLVLYCYFKGIRSSRKIAAACIDDVGCRVICGGAAPSHQAAAQFVRRHRAEVVRLFVQVLGLLAAAGAVEGHCAAVDGSPVSGNASRFANLDASSWRPGSPRWRQRSAPRRRRGWPAQPRRTARAASRRHCDDDDDGPGGGPGGGVPRRLSAMAATLARLRAAQDKLAARRQAAPARSPDARVTAARDAVGNAGQAAGPGRAGPGRPDGEVPGRGGRREGLGGQEARPRREQRPDRPDPQEPGHRPGAGWPPPRPAPPRPGRPRCPPPTRTPGCCPPRTAAATCRAGTWSWPPPAARSCSPPSCTTTPPTAGALITMIATAAANCALAGLAGQIRAWLADNGYASAANFAALEHLMLLVAVTGEAAQPAAAPAAARCRPAGRKWPPGWPPRPGRSCTSAAPPRSSPPSPSCSPGSAATSTTAAATPSTPRSSSWAPCTTSPSSSEFRRRHPAAAPA